MNFNNKCFCLRLQPTSIYRFEIFARSLWCSEIKNTSQKLPPGLMPTKDFVLYLSPISRTDSTKPNYNLCSTCQFAILILLSERFCSHFTARHSEKIAKTPKPVLKCIFLRKTLCFFRSIMKPILSIGMICEDTVVHVDKFPVEDADQRTLNQWKTTGGNANNTGKVLAGFGLSVE